MSQPALTLLINAGGVSRRMGRNKALLRLGDELLIVRIMRRLQPLATAGAIVVTNDADVAGVVDAEPGVRVVADHWPQGGALGGLASGLALSSGWTMAVACDMPFVDAGLFRHLASLANDACDAVVPQTESHAQGFHALYHPRCLPAMEACLDEGRLALMAALDRLRVRWVAGDELAYAMTTADAFLNVNTPEEWAAVQMRLHNKTGR